MENSSSDYQTKKIICSTLEILDILFVHKIMLHRSRFWTREILIKHFISGVNALVIYKNLYLEQYQVKVSYLSGNTIGFDPQTQKLELRTK